jgi:hypothetical protein
MKKYRPICRKSSRPFLAKILPASFLGVSAATKAENSGGWIRNDYNSDGKHNRSVHGRSFMGRFVPYHPVTVTSNCSSYVAHRME